MAKNKVKSPSDEELIKIVKKACDNFEGDSTVLESAIGCLFWGRVVGWHGIRLMHSSRTFKRYEEILDVKFREILPERTSQSSRMLGVRLADDLGKFWQVVTAGMVPASKAKIAEAL